MITPRTCSVSTCQLNDLALRCSAYLAYPQGLAIDSACNLYIADDSHYVIRMISASTGIISTVAQKRSRLLQRRRRVRQPSAGLRPLSAFAIDSAGDLDIVSQNAGRIRKVTASTGIITTAAGKRKSDWQQRRRRFVNYC